CSAGMGVNVHWGVEISISKGPEGQRNRARLLMARRTFEVVRAFLRRRLTWVRVEGAESPCDSLLFVSLIGDIERNPPGPRQASPGGLKLSPRTPRRGCPK